MSKFISGIAALAVAALLILPAGPASAAGNSYLERVQRNFDAIPQIQSQNPQWWRATDTFFSTLADSASITPGMQTVWGAATLASTGWNYLPYFGTAIIAPLFQ